MYKLLVTGKDTNDRDILPKSFNNNVMVESKHKDPYRKLDDSFTYEGLSLTGSTKSLINDPSTSEAICLALENELIPSTAAHPWGEEDEVVYDTVLKKGSEDDSTIKAICFEDAKDLFDDPGYTKGMMAKKLPIVEAGSYGFQSSEELRDGVVKKPSHSELSSSNHILCGNVSPPHAESDSSHTGSILSGTNKVEKNSVRRK